jgi:hypothetical protein
MGRVAASLLEWSSRWWLTTFCVLLAAMLAFLGTALCYEFGVRRLRAMHGAHWTELARAYTEVSETAVRFRRWLVLGVLVLALPHTTHGLGAGSVLRFIVGVWVSFTLVTYAIDAHWVRVATAGQLAPHTPRQALQISLVWWSSRLVVPTFAAAAPDRYDVWGVLWALGFVAALVACGQASGRLADMLGILRPLAAELDGSLARQAKRVGQRPAKARLISSPRVFAGAAWPGYLVVSSGAVESLARHELVTLAVSQLNWLRSSVRAKAWTSARAVAFNFVPVACVPGFPEAPWAGVILAAFPTPISSTSGQRQAR